MSMDSNHETGYSTFLFSVRQLFLLSQQIVETLTQLLLQKEELVVV